MRRGVPVSRIVAPATVGIDTPGIDSYRSSLVRAGHRRDAPARGPSSIARRTSGASLLRRPTSLTIRSGSPRVPASWRDGRPGHRARARASSPSGGRRGRADARAGADARARAATGGFPSRSGRAPSRRGCCAAPSCLVSPGCAAHRTGGPGTVELVAVIARFVPHATGDPPMVAGTRLHPRCTDRGPAVMFQTRAGARRPGRGQLPVGLIRKGCR